MAPLHVYKASAGSGKTYHLTRVYVEMLFRNPDVYRQILAVTFTNKAAGEMKLRILDRLHDLSTAEDDDHDLIYFCQSLQLEKQELRTKARKILIKILNGYSWFSVGTIDRFFQAVIRAFTREMGLPAGFALELDHDRMLGEAVDRMFMHLQDDPDLLKWLMTYAEERVGEEKNWNFREELLGLGKELFREAFQSVLMDKEAMPDRHKLGLFIQKLNTITSDSEREIIQITQLCADTLHAAGYSIDDFHNKYRGPLGLLDRILNARNFSMTDSQIKAVTDFSRWHAKNEDDQNKLSLIRDTLMPAYQKILNRLIRLNSVLAIKKNVFSLGILSDLSEEILEISNEKNIFLLSDASRLLRGLIGNNPTPFVYEKTGTRIAHIMLDEFQDTSVFQWENFRPLLEHSLSIGTESLVVGDVKQSIYRWRNGDWKILAEELERSFGNHELEDHTLNHNWRSRDELIKCFNTIFTHAPVIITEGVNTLLDEASMEESAKERWRKLLETAYSESYQEIPEKRVGSGGYFRAEILEEDGEKFEDLADRRLVNWIRELQDAGYKAGDIAILVRWNREGARVADVLMEEMENAGLEGYDFTFISNESLYLYKNPAIVFLLALLNHMNDPADKLNRLLLHRFYRLINPSDQKSRPFELHEDPDTAQLLGDKFAREIPFIKRLPLFELIEKLIDIFHLNRQHKDLPYLQAFQQLVLEYQSDSSATIHDFLLFWKEHGQKKVLKVAEGQDAIRIMTIHKAKGLQFKAVILPFCKWPLGSGGGGNRTDILWCNTEGTEFSKLPLVPVRSSSLLKNTVFATNYVEEQIMNRVDALNLLYVGMTRAEDALIAGIPPEDAKGEIKNAGHLLWSAAKRRILSDKQGYMDFNACMNEQGAVVGTLPEDEKTRKPGAKDWMITNYPVHISNERLCLRLKSSSYMDPGSEDKFTRKFGTMMHEIFSRIVCVDDVGEVMKSYKREGSLKENEYRKLLDYVSGKLQTPGVKQWFEPGLKIMNERSILSEGEAYRPDRVVIGEAAVQVVDYKFGHAEHGYYRRQVDDYCRLISEMGYENVSGYLWYVELDKTEKVV